MDKETHRRPLSKVVAAGGRGGWACGRQLRSRERCERVGLRSGFRVEQQRGGPGRGHPVCTQSPEPLGRPAERRDSADRGRGPQGERGRSSEG